MDKVKLPKEVAEALDVISSSLQNDTIYSRLTAFQEIRGKFPYMHMDDILKALVNGFEVELTPEDKVRKQFTYLVSPNSGQSIEQAALKHAEADGIKFVLEVYNIKIEEVNA